MHLFALLVVTYQLVVTTSMKTIVLHARPRWALRLTPSGTPDKNSQQKSSSADDGRIVLMNDAWLNFT